MSVIERFMPNTLFGRNLETIKTEAIKLVVISGLVLLSVALPIILPPQFAPVLMAVPMAIAFLLVVLRWPGLRVSVVIVAGMVVPISVGTGSGSSLNAGMLALGGLVGIWILERIVHRYPWNFIQSPTFTPLISLVVVAVLSFVVGQLSWYALAAQAPLQAQIGGLGIIILSAVAYIWVGHQIKELRWLQLATWTCIGLGAVYVIGSVVPQLQPYVQRLFPYGSTEGSLFWTWLTVLVFSQLFFNKNLPMGWRAILAMILAATLYISVFRFRTWSSGWVPPLAAIFAILWFGRPKLAIWVTLIAGAVGIFQAQSFLNNLIWIGDNSYSLSTRFEAWLIVGEIAKVSPILGLGPANYYWYTPLFPIRGYAVQFNSHSQFVDLFAQTGILGLICFIWFAAKVGQLGWQLRLRVPAGFSRAYVIGALGGLVGTIVAAALGDWVLPFVYNVGFNGFRASMLGWLFLGGLIALAQIYSNSEYGDTSDVETNH